MTEYHFEMRYKPGEKNTVADYLSRNVVHALRDESGSVEEAQRQDEDIAKIKRFLKTGKLPTTKAKETQWIRRIAEKCTVKDDLVWHSFSRPGFRTKDLLLVPQPLREMIIEAAHVSVEAGHGGENRTCNRVMQDYWWPGLTSQVAKYIQKCTTCRLSKAKPDLNAPLHSLPLCTIPNERVHIDLFGPLKVSQGGHKFIMVMTDAFTKLVELAAIEDKMAETVARNFFEKWICRFSAPRFVVTDQGKEFCNQVLDTVCELWGTNKKRTSSYHPQSNSSAESYNRSMVKYMRAVLDNDKTTDWEHYLAPMMLSYNTHIHRATKESPFFLTYLHDPRLPTFDIQKPRKLYHETNWAVEAFQTMQAAQMRVHTNLGEAQRRQEEYFNRTAKEKEFMPGDKVMVYFPNVPQGCNPKFFTKWRAFTVVKMVGPVNVAVKEGPKHKELLIHINRARLLTPAEKASTQTSDTLKDEPAITQEAEPRYNLRSRKKNIAAIHGNGQPGSDGEEEDWVQIRRGQRRRVDDPQIIPDDNNFRTANDATETGTSAGNFFHFLRNMSPKTRRELTSFDESFHSAPDDDDEIEFNFHDARDDSEDEPQNDGAFMEPETWEKQVEKIPQTERHTRSKGKTVDIPLPTSCPTRQKKKKLDMATILGLMIIGLTMTQARISIHKDVLHAVRKAERKQVKSNSMDTKFNISPMTPKQQFIQDGIVYTETIRGHIRIRLEFYQVFDRINMATTAARIQTKVSDRRVQDILPGLDSAKQNLDSIVKFFITEWKLRDRAVEPRSRIFMDGPTAVDFSQPRSLKDFIIDQPEPIPRDKQARMSVNWASLTSGMLGLYNTYENKKTRHLAEANSKAVNKVMEQVDAVKEYAERNNEEVGKTQSNLLRVSALRDADALSEFWDRTIRLIDAIEMVAATATRQRLDPAIRQIIDLDDIWRGFVRKIRGDDWIPAFKHSQHLHQVPVSFQGSKQAVDIQVHIPLRQVEATRWKLLRFIPRPILHGNVMLTILPIKARLAVDAETQAYMELESDVLDSCTHLPQTWYCPETVKVIHTDSAGSCLAAIWTANWRDIQEMCWLRIRKPRVTAWAEGPTSFVVIAPETITGIINCPHKTPASATLQGYQAVSLDEGCTLTTTDFKLHAGNGTLDERFSVSVDTNGTKVMDNLHLANISFQIARPMSIHSVKTEVRNILREGKSWTLFSTGTWIALGLGLAALVIIIAFITFLWCKIKLAQHPDVTAAVKAIKGRIFRTKKGINKARWEKWKHKSRNSDSSNTSKSNKYDIEQAQTGQVEQINMLTLTSNLWDFDHLTLQLPVEGRAHFWGARQEFRTSTLEGKTCKVVTDPAFRHNYIDTDFVANLTGWYPMNEGPGFQGYERHIKWEDEITIGLTLGEYSWNLPVRCTEQIGLPSGTTLVLGARWMADLDLMIEMYGEPAESFEHRTEAPYHRSERLKFKKFLQRLQTCSLNDQPPPPGTEDERPPSPYPKDPLIGLAFYESDLDDRPFPVILPYPDKSKDSEQVSPVPDPPISQRDDQVGKDEERPLQVDAIQTPTFDDIFEDEAFWNSFPTFPTTQDEPWASTDERLTSSMDWANTEDNRMEDIIRADDLDLVQVRPKVELDKNWAQYPGFSEWLNNLANGPGDDGPQLREWDDGYQYDSGYESDTDGNDSDYVDLVDGPPGGLGPATRPDRDSGDSPIRGRRRRRPRAWSDPIVSNRKVPWKYNWNYSYRADAGLRRGSWT